VRERERERERGEKESNSLNVKEQALSFSSTQFKIGMNKKRLNTFFHSNGKKHIPCKHNRCQHLL
jgi:hypothetical protein